MSRNLLKKITDISILSRLFDFIPRKKAVILTLINKKLSCELNLSIDEYLLEEKYRQIIQRSNGSINEIFLQCFKFYKESDISKMTFPELVQKILKYMKFLLDTKKIKYFSLYFNNPCFSQWPSISFIIEAMRYLKKGISIENVSGINFLYYDILKDAIYNLDEVHSVVNFAINRHNCSCENIFKLYYEMFDWTKVRCVDLTKILKSKVGKSTVAKDIKIPDYANFRKLKIDDACPFGCNELIQFMLIHGEHLDSIKILNYRDNNINTMFFQNLKKIRKVKFINCIHFIFYNFLFFFKKNLSDIKVLVLDEILEKDINDKSDKQNIYIIENILPRLTNLEKLELNFKYASNNIFKLLSKIVSQNPNLQRIKISLDFDYKKIKQQTPSFIDQFLGKENDLEDNYLKDFYTFIKDISSLKQLSSLDLNFSLNDKMSQIVTTFLNVGSSLKNLKMIHTKKLNVTQLLYNHPNLIKINLCLSENNSDETKEKFKYEFSQRCWKSIVLKNYPLNDSFIEALSKAKNYICDLTLENAMNICQKSDYELNNILLAIKNNRI